MWVEETKNGKFKFVERYEDYLTGKSKRVSIVLDKNTAQTRKLAQSTLNQKIEQVFCKKEEKNVSLRNLVEEYRKDQKLTVKQSTYTRNYYACDTLLSILGEHTLVNRLSARYIRERFIETGKGPGTLNEHLTRFKALIRWGYHNDLVSEISFLDKIEPFKDKPHKEKIQDKYLESDELKTLLQGMKIEIWEIITEFLALSGLRFGEAAALENTDVDTKNNIIHVDKTFDSINLTVTTPKTPCSIRNVFMQTELKELCRKIKSYMLRQKLLNCCPDSPLFLCDTKGEHIKYYTYNKYLKENAKRLLGREITAHTLRHTHASLLLENGVSIDAISRRLGHENSKVTQEIYLHITERLREKDNAQIAGIKIM